MRIGTSTSAMAGRPCCCGQCGVFVYALKDHCAVVGSCYTPGRPSTEHVRLRPRSAFFEGGGSVSANISQGRGRRPPTTVGVRKLE